MFTSRRSPTPAVGVVETGRLGFFVFLLDAPGDAALLGLAGGCCRILNRLVSSSLLVTVAAVIKTVRIRKGVGVTVVD